MPIERTSTSPTRESLRAAIMSASGAKTQRDLAADATARAAGLVAQAKTAVDKFADLEKRLVGHRVGAIKLAVVSGAGAPGPETLLPPELLNERADRDRAIEHLAAAEAAASELADELRDAEAVFGAARDRVASAAGAVITSLLDTLARELSEAKRRTWLLEDEITAAARVWISITEKPGCLPAGPYAGPAPRFGAVSLTTETAAELIRARPQRAPPVENSLAAEISPAMAASFYHFDDECRCRGRADRRKRRDVGHRVPNHVHRVDNDHNGATYD